MPRQPEPGPRRFPVTMLGVDPSLGGTGIVLTRWEYLRQNRLRAEVMGHATVAAGSDRWPLARRLTTLRERAVEAIKLMAPRHWFVGDSDDPLDSWVVMEDPTDFQRFAGRQKRGGSITTARLGAATGVLLVALYGWAREHRLGFMAYGQRDWYPLQRPGQFEKQERVVAWLTRDVLDPAQRANLTTDEVMAVGVTHHHLRRWIAGQVPVGHRGSAQRR